MLAMLTDQLRRRDGVRVLGPLGFENAYALVMRADRASALAVSTIADLRLVAPRLRLATDIEFPSRPEWQAVRAAYGLRFASLRPYQPTFMYRALADGEADVISAFSSDGRIAAERLRVLADTRSALPPYDAVVLLSPRRAADRRLLTALTPLLGALSVETMRGANLSVDRDADKLTPAAAAAGLARSLRLAYRADSR